jgi:glycosyltransferase 2 family protein
MTNSNILKRVSVKGAGSVLGLLIGAVCVTLGITRVDWPETWDVFRRLDPVYLALGVALLLICFLANAERWRYLLDTERPIARHRLLGYLMIGYMGNAVFPMRPGDLTRATLLRYRDMVPITTALTSLVLERLLDVLTVLLIGFALSFMVDLPRVVTTALQVFAVAALSATAILVAMSTNLIPGERLLALALRWAPARLANFVAARAGQFIQALGVLHHLDRVPKILLTDIAAWTALGLSMVSFAQALHLGVPWTAGFLVLVVVSLGAAIPGPPGAVGVFHVLTVLALSVYSVDTEMAVAFALVAHTTAIALHIGLGAASAFILNVRVVRARKAAAEPSPLRLPEGGPAGSPLAG